MSDTNIYTIFTGPSWPWTHGIWIYNYLCNQCLSSLMLWVRISIRARCTILCDKVCQWLATGRWSSAGPPVSSTIKTDRHDITEISLKVALNTIKQTNTIFTKISLPLTIHRHNICNVFPFYHTWKTIIKLYIQEFPRLTFVLPTISTPKNMPCLRDWRLKIILRTKLYLFLRYYHRVCIT